MEEDIITKPYPKVVRPKGGRMAIPKALGGTPAPAKEEEIKIGQNPYIPAMAYDGDPVIPGYWLDDIKKLLHPDDYKELMCTVEDVFEENGRKKVYALTYIRWLNAPHEE